MNALHQYLFDAYRAARYDEPPPPVPGTFDVAELRAAVEHRRFEAVLAGRPAGPGPAARAARRVRTALNRLGAALRSRLRTAPGRPPAARGRGSGP